MNSTLQGSATSGDTVANRTAVAAAVLAAGAFVVAFAQFILDYFSSSEARNKCTFPAIDASAKQVKFGFNRKFVKLRVYYPVLDFSFASILQLQGITATKAAINSPESPIEAIRAKHDGRWRAVTEQERITWKHIA